MSIKATELGRIESGSAVCFSKEAIERLADLIGMEASEIVDTFGGVRADVPAAGPVGVDKATAVDGDGKTYSVIVIGAEPKTFLRFLHDDEQTFGDWYGSHPRRAEVGKGATFNAELYRELTEEYRKKVLEKTK